MNEFYNTDAAPAIFGIDWSGPGIPTPNKQITQADFMASVFLSGYCPTHWGYGQAKINDTRYDVHYVVCHKAVFAMAARYLGHIKQPGHWGGEFMHNTEDGHVLVASRTRFPGSLLQDHYNRGYAILFFMIGCPHPKDRVENLPARWDCDHRFRCLDCGFQWGYDSSG